MPHRHWFWHEKSLSFAFGKRHESGNLTAKLLVNSHLLRSSAPDFESDLLGHSVGLIFGQSVAIPPALLSRNFPQFNLVHEPFVHFEYSLLDGGLLHKCAGEFHVIGSDDVCRVLPDFLLLGS